MTSNRYVICAACDAMNPTFGETCDQCGARIEVAADAAEATASPATAVKRTYFQTPSAMRLIGIWSLSVPNVLAGAYMSFSLPKHVGGLAGFITFWLMLGLTCVWFVIFYQVTRNYFFPKKPIRR